MAVISLYLLFVSYLNQKDAIADWQERDRAIVVYTGKSNTADLLELARLRFEKFEPYWIIGIGLNLDLFKHASYFSFEWNNQFVKHFEKWGLSEIDTLISFRWHWFPWNRFLQTSLAFGEGFSFATGYPSSEAVSQNIRSKFLNALLTEVAFALPRHSDWSLIARLHHRSGIYGTINGVNGGSNYVTFGLMKRFGGGR